MFAGEFSRAGIAGLADHISFFPLSGILVHVLEDSRGSKSFRLPLHTPIQNVVPLGGTGAFRPATVPKFTPT